jgi:hypothetical protein
MTTEILLNIAVVLASMGGLIAVGLWILNSMMEDDPHDQHFYGDDTSNLPTPPPEPEH